MARPLSTTKDRIGRKPGDQVKPKKSAEEKAVISKANQEKAAAKKEAAKPVAKKAAKKTE